MSDRTTQELLAEILTVTDHRRLARMMGLGEDIFYKWKRGVYTPKPANRERLERLAVMARDFRRVAAGEPLAEDLIV